jgi:hypothetical protein
MRQSKGDKEGAMRKQKAVLEQEQDMEKYYQLDK